MVVRLIKWVVRAFTIGVVVGMFALPLQLAVDLYESTPSVTRAGNNYTFTLSGSFGAFTYPYKGLVNTLNKAKRGDKITIVITHHRGGRNTTREYISNAIARTKATVVIHVKSYAASNAALLYRHGNTAIINKSAVFLYHQSYKTDNFGRKSYPKFLYYWSVREHRKVGAFVFMTEAERSKWERKFDVVISGHRICSSKFVISNHKDYCVIRGIK